MNYTNKSSYLCNKTINSKILDAHTPSNRWIFIGLTAPLTLVTVILNIMLIVRISKRKQHRIFTRTFLTSNAVADFCVGSIIMPFSIYGRFYDIREIFGNQACNVANSCDVMFTSTSMLHFTVLAFERFIAIRFPFSYKTICGRKTLIPLLIVCWIVPATISFGLIVPNLNSKGVEILDDCATEQAKLCVLLVNIFYAVVPGVIGFWAPTACVMVFNVIVCRTLQQQKRFRNKMFGQNIKSYSHVQMRRESHATFIVSMMTCSFLLFWTPFFVSLLVRILVNFEISDVATVTVLWMGLANSAANPTLFFFLELRKQ